MSSIVPPWTAHLHGGEHTPERQIGEHIQAGVEPVEVTGPNEQAEGFRHAPAEEWGQARIDDCQRVRKQCTATNAVTA